MYRASLGAPGRGGARCAVGGEGGMSLLTEAKQKGTVHRSVPQVLYIK